MVSCSHWGMFPEEYWIGEYRVDYSALTDAELAAHSSELEELYRNSYPVGSYDSKYLHG